MPFPGTKLTKYLSTVAGGPDSGRRRDDFTERLNVVGGQTAQRSGLVSASTTVRMAVSPWVPLDRTKLTGGDAGWLKVRAYSTDAAGTRATVMAVQVAYLTSGDGRPL